jgi:hypothetical protein
MFFKQNMLLQLLGNHTACNQLKQGGMGMAKYISV